MPCGTVDAVLSIQQGAADAAGQLNSMLGCSRVLSKHIVYTILSTSLTLFRATLSTRGERDALEEEVSDGREGKLYP